MRRLHHHMRLKLCHTHKYKHTYTHTHLVAHASATGRMWRSTRMRHAAEGEEILAYLTMATRRSASPNCVWVGYVCLET